MNTLCSREKYWSELNDQEKVERCRREIKRQKEQIKELRDTVQKLVNHSHEGQRIVVPFERYSGQVERNIPLPDDQVIF